MLIDSCVYDYTSLILDQIALEGLDGITIEALFIRLRACSEFSLSLDTIECREFVWKLARRMCTRGYVQFFYLTAARPPLVVVDRLSDEISGVLIEPNVASDDPYPYSAIDDKERRVRGSCTTYYTRQPLSEELLNASLHSIEQNSRHMNRIVIVASQTLRNKAIFGRSSCIDVDSELSLSQYLQMERIARSRYSGETTIGEHSLSVISDDSKNLFYLRKKLIELKLITKQNINIRFRNGKMLQGRLFHLPRFYKEYWPKYVFVIEEFVNALKKLPKNMIVAAKAPTLVSCSISGMKKIMKMPDFSRVVSSAMIPYREMFTDASLLESKSKCGKDKILRVLFLQDPNVDVKKVLSATDEDLGDQEEMDMDACVFPNQSNLEISHSLEYQAFCLMNFFRSKGITTNNIRRELGQTMLDARALIKNIISIPDATYSFKEEVSRASVTRYVSLKYKNCDESNEMEKVDEQSLNITNEESFYNLVDYDLSQGRLLDLSTNSQDFSNSEDIIPQNDNLVLPSKDDSELYRLSDISWKLEMFDPFLKRVYDSEFPYFNLDDSFLFKKPISIRKMRRKQIIIDEIQQLKIIDNIHAIRKKIELYERSYKDGNTGQMDKRSFYRILRALAEAHIINIFRLTIVPDNMDISHRLILTSYNIKKDSAELVSAMSELALALSLKKRAFRYMRMINPENFDSRNKSANFISKLPHPDAMIYTEPNYYMPKFTRSFLLHDFLFYLSVQYTGCDSLDQLEAASVLSQHFDSELETNDLPPIYNLDMSCCWKLFVAPLPLYRDRGPRWCWLADVLMRLPLSVYMRQLKPRYVTDELLICLNHPIKRHYPLTHLPNSVAACIFWRNKSLTSMYYEVSRLVFMGLLQLGHQSLSRDQMFIYVNRHASLCDTRPVESSGYMISADVKCDVTRYELDQAQDVARYWSDCKKFSLHTRLGNRSLIERTFKRHPFAKQQLLELLRAKLPDEAVACDTGALVGDTVGAAGIDSSLFSYVMRNWIKSAERNSNSHSGYFIDDDPAFRLYYGSFTMPLNPRKHPLTLSDSQSLRRKRLKLSDGNVTVVASDERIFRKKSMSSKNKLSLIAKSKIKNAVKSCLSKKYLSTIDRLIPPTWAHLAVRKIRPRTKYSWSTDQSWFFVLSRVAIFLLSGSRMLTHNQLVIIKDAFSLAYPKSSEAISFSVLQKRVRMVLGLQNYANLVDLIIQECRHLNEVNEIAQNVNETDVADYLDKYLKLMKFLNKFYSSIDISNVIDLPSNYDDLRLTKKFITFKGSFCSFQFKLLYIETNDDIRTCVCCTTVQLKLFAEKTLNFFSSSLFWHAIKQFPHKIQLNSFAFLRANRVISIPKTERKLVFTTGCCYYFSQIFRSKFTQKYAYTLYRDCFSMYKSMVTSCIGQRSPLFYDSRLYDGSHSSLIVSLLALDMIEFCIQVPSSLLGFQRGNSVEKDENSDYLDDDFDNAIRNNDLSSFQPFTIYSRSIRGLKKANSRIVSYSCQVSFSFDTHTTQLMSSAIPSSSSSADIGVDDKSSASPDVYINNHQLISSSVIQAVLERNSRFFSWPPQLFAKMLDDLLSRNILSEDDSLCVLNLADILWNAGSLGIHPHSAMVTSGMTRPCFTRIVELMAQHEMLYCCGYNDIVYVHPDHVEPWLLQTYDVRSLDDSHWAELRDTQHNTVLTDQSPLQRCERRHFIPTPWRELQNASLNRAVFDRFLGLILSHCLRYVGSTLLAIQERFHHLLTPFQTRLLVKDLQALGVVELTEIRSTVAMSLFTDRNSFTWYIDTADDCSKPEDILVEPVPGSVLLLSYFIGDPDYKCVFMPKN